MWVHVGGGVLGSWSWCLQSRALMCTDTPCVFVFLRVPHVPVRRPILPPEVRDAHFECTMKHKVLMKSRV